LVPGGDWYVDLVSSSGVVAQPISRARTKHSTATPIRENVAHCRVEVPEPKDQVVGCSKGNGLRFKV
jgi:hypothetical protein